MATLPEEARQHFCGTMVLDVDIGVEQVAHELQPGSLLRQSIQKNLSHYSSSQKARMQFGGLEWELEYVGEMTPFLPWQRAEVTHLGGKTTFGFGRIACRCA